MSQKITESTLMKVLNWIYDKAEGRIPGLDSARELAEGYIREGGSKRDQANSLIRWQNTKAGISGFVSGFGGLITMPITLPAEITSVLYIQIRMIAAIAHIGDHDLKDDKLKTLVYACLVGNGAKELIKNAGMQIGKKLATNTIKNMSGKVITQINQKVGFRLVTKFGEKGVVNLGKAIPVWGGIIGGTVDVVTTNTIGDTAVGVFIGEH